MANPPLRGFGCRELRLDLFFLRDMMESDVPNIGVRVCVGVSVGVSVDGYKWISGTSWKTGVEGDLAAGARKPTPTGSTGNPERAFRGCKSVGFERPISKEIPLKRRTRGQSGERFYPVRARRFQTP